MKTSLLFLAAIFFFTKSIGQDRWTVQLNSKTLLTAKAEDTVANVISVDDLKKGSLIVTYTPGKMQSNLGRKLAVYDAADNQLYVREAFSITLPIATLKKWRDTLSQVKVYTWLVSKDPRIKLKVRRVHLCTINFD